MLHERVAGIDVHKEMIKVAIRCPGEKPWTRTTEILEFRTFYGVLQEMARELRRRGVTHVVMEASGVYTEPVYYALCEQDGCSTLKWFCLTSRDGHNRRSAPPRDSSYTRPA